MRSIGFFQTQQGVRRGVWVSLTLALLTGGLLLRGPATHALAQSGSGAGKGTVEKIAVYGPSLEGNLEGDSPMRDVFVYLPPSYAANPNRRYPVVYFLHGYGIGAEQYWNIMTVPEAADRELAAGNLREIILVHPDANTIYNGRIAKPPST